MSCTHQAGPSRAPFQALAMECANEVPCNLVRVEVQEASVDADDTFVTVPGAYLEPTCQCVKTCETL